MTSTMSQSIKTAKRDQAANLAAKNGEPTAIVASVINDEPVQMLFSVSVVENSPNKDNIEVIAVIDKDGQFVD